MESILNTLKNIRNSGDFSINPQNSNRYRIVVWENDGSQTAYYFSAPIYEQDTLKLVKPSFFSSAEGYTAKGSNSSINIDKDGVRFSSPVGMARIIHDLPNFQIENGKLIANRLKILPTINGAVFLCDVSGKKGITFRVHTDQSFLGIRSNSKYFALMHEEFRPFFLVSSIGTYNQYDQLVEPALVAYQMLDDKQYLVHIYPSNSDNDVKVMFECNMYEEKLFQDTTVESKNPDENNAFGGVGFIGNSNAFGEQWLYSRLNYNKLSELFGRIIGKAVLHIPKFNNGVPLIGVGIQQRFCSFGSNWNNKINDSYTVSETTENNGFYKISITDLLINRHTRNFNMSEGLILKTKAKESGFSAIATGDNYYAPQVLEINFR